MSTREEDAKKLLLEIAGCSIARQRVERPDPSPPCSTIVSVQAANSWASLQIPEPWTGHLLQAPILFLSSNPSISNAEAYPKGSADVDLWDFFDSRFDGYWIKDGTKALSADLRTYGKPIHYWSCIRNRATELLGNEAEAGVDYAFSEIVHCKSKGEVGVTAALNACAERYLMKLLACSGAVVLVLVGKKALDRWNAVERNSLKSLPIVPEKDGTEYFEISRRKRLAVFLPSPTFHGPQKFASCLSNKKIEEIRDFISVSRKIG